MAHIVEAGRSQMTKVVPQEPRSHVSTWEPLWPVVLRERRPVEGALPPIAPLQRTRNHLPCSQIRPHGLAPAYLCPTRSTEDARQAVK